MDDPRYPQSSLKYIFALHNHPFEDNLSKKDIPFIVSMGKLHGFAVETKTTTVQLAVIAFFSRSDDLKSPTCDGFFEYIPTTGEVTKWTPTRGTWDWERVGSVEWLNDTDYVFHPE